MFGIRGENILQRPDFTLNGEVMTLFLRVSRVNIYEEKLKTIF